MLFSSSSVFLIILSVSTLCFITWLSVSIRFCSNYCCLSWFVSSHLPSLYIFYIRRCSPPRSAVLPSSFLFLSPSLTHKRVLFIFPCNHIFCIPLPSLLCISACCTCQHWFFYTLSKLALSLFFNSASLNFQPRIFLFSLSVALSLSLSALVLLVADCVKSVICCVRWPWAHAWPAPLC